MSIVPPPPIFQLSPPPQPSLALLLELNDYESIEMLKTQMNTFKCKLINQASAGSSSSSSSGSDINDKLNLNSFLIFILIAFIFAMILVFLILFIVNYFRNKLLKNENYIKSLRSSTSTSSSSSCTNSTQLSGSGTCSVVDDCYLKANKQIKNGHVVYLNPQQPPLHQLLLQQQQQQLNDDYFYYYQRVYSEINENDMATMTTTTATPSTATSTLNTQHSTNNNNNRKSVHLIPAPVTLSHQQHQLFKIPVYNQQLQFNFTPSV